MMFNKQNKFINSSINILSLLSVVFFSIISPTFAFDAFENKELIQPLVALYKRFNAEQSEEFIKITSNPNIMGGNFEKELKEFGKKNGVLEEYKNLKNSYHNWRVQLFKLAGENLAGSALKAFQKIKEFSESKPSPNITLGEQCKRLNEILAETDSMIRNFLPNEPGDFLCLNAEKKRKMVQRIVEDFGK